MKRGGNLTTSLSVSIQALHTLYTMWMLALQTTLHIVLNGDDATLQDLFSPTIVHKGVREGHSLVILCYRVLKGSNFSLVTCQMMNDQLLSIYIYHVNV